MQVSRDLAAVCAASAVHLASFGAAHADVGPPDGLLYVRDVRLRVENVEELSDWVLIAYPCTPADPSIDLDPYCVVRDSAPYALEGNLYALRAQDTVIRDPKVDLTPKEREALRDQPVSGRPPAVRIVKPDTRGDSAAFFGTDRRLVRSEVLLNRGLSYALENTGVRSALYTLRIARIAADGLEVRFLRASYTCGNGTRVDLDWGADQRSTPVPSCPAFDDQGGILGAADAGAGQAGAERASFAPDPAAQRFPSGRRGMFWLGAALASASLLGAGLLLRKGDKA